ncbi:MAG: DUF1559 domain-containing protein [Planctomycetes bacterium]|nr:DUF1559 domain-containing protein [Planctomycetota bacterium]
MSNSPDPYRSLAPSTATASSTSGKAIASLVLGLGSLVCSIVTAIPGLIFGIMSLGDISRSEGRVSGRGMAITGIVLSVALPLLNIICLLIALLVPAVGAARQAARRAQSANNLRQITMAAHQYESQNRRLPAVADDSQGAPVSWRVDILPFMEQISLYKLYDKTQPWNSEKNRTVSDRHMPLYSSPEERALNNTHYLAVMGPGTAFEGNKPIELQRFGSISQTILYVEADAAVPWAEPKDYNYNPADPAAGLGGLRPSGFMAAMGDGSIRTIPADTDPAVLRALMSRDGDDNQGVDSALDQ